MCVNAEELRHFRSQLRDALGTHVEGDFEIDFQVSEPLNSRSLHVVTQRQDHVLPLLQLREDQQDEDASQRCVRAKQADGLCGALSWSGVCGSLR